MFARWGQVRQLTTRMPGVDTYARCGHVHQMKTRVRTRSLRQLWVFITRENALLAPLARLIGEQAKQARRYLVMFMVCNRYTMVVRDYR